MTNATEMHHKRANLKADAEKAVPDDAPERLSDFWWRLKTEGVDMKHIREMLGRISSERDEAMAEAARLFYRNGKPMTPIDIADELHRLHLFAEGVYASIFAVSENPDEGLDDGAKQIALELSRSLKRLAEAVSAEQHLWCRDKGASA